MLHGLLFQEIHTGLELGDAKVLAKTHYCCAKSHPAVSLPT
jgi:hypothetical protein